MKKVFYASAYLYLFIYLVLVVSLFYFFDGETFLKILKTERVLFSIKLSLVTATIVTFLVIILALPSAYALSKYNLPMKTLIDGLLELPIIVSPSALGAMILIFFNTPLGDFVKSFKIDVVFAFTGIIVAQFIATAGLAVRLVKSTFDEIPKRYEDVAKTLGASSSKVFFLITLPLSKRGIFASALVVWAKALGEFGATITVAGSMSMKTETLPVAIYMSLARANIEEAVVLIFIILTLGIGSILIVKLFFSKTGVFG